MYCLILQVRVLKLSAVKNLTRGHITGKWLSWNFSLGFFFFFFKAKIDKWILFYFEYNQYFSCFFLFIFN